MSENAKGSIVAMVLAWAVVVLPATWGVTQTVKKSLPLFSALSMKAPTTTASPATTAPIMPNLSIPTTVP